MARIIKRHWKSLLVQIGLIALTIILGLQSLYHPPKVAVAVSAPNDTVTPLDVKTFTRIQALRQKLALTTRDLAAAGCSQADATKVLGTVLAWVTANSAAWDTQEQNQREAHRVLNEAIREINVGPPSATVSTISALPGLQQAAGTADQNYNQFIQAAADIAAAQLTAAEEQVIATARGNVAISAPDICRYVSGLTAQQVASLKLTMYRAGGSIPPGTSGVNTTASEQASANVNQNMAAVAAAEVSVLPAPAGY